MTKFLEWQAVTETIRVASEQASIGLRVSVPTGATAMEAFEAIRKVADAARVADEALQAAIWEDLQMSPSSRQLAKPGVDRGPHPPVTWSPYLMALPSADGHRL
jgi:hypothetical protein